MRSDPLSTCERNFILEALKLNRRLDDRTINDFRQVKLVVGSECGTALCTMGLTKVFVAISAVLKEPSKARPHKGMIYVDVDMSPMGNPVNEHSRLGERGMELTRLLELVLRDSHCVDIESLCVRAEKEVWSLRVDVRILDDDGSLLDCASVASVAALHHFRRPQVTIEPHHTIIHSEWEKPMIPLNIYHMPICVTFGFVDNGSIVLVDPTDKEQQCLSGTMVVACNKRREVCALHQSTNMIMTTSIIEQCVQRAMQRVQDLSDLVSSVIKDDSVKRSKYMKPDGFETTIDNELLTYGESHPNELIAPAITLDSIHKPTQKEIKKELVQNSVVLNENPLGEGSSQLDEQAEQKVLASQVDAISRDVRQVNLTNTSVNNRRAAEEELDDLLDGLDDDLEGETMELSYSIPTNDIKTEQPEPEIDLLAAKKKKKK